MPFASDSAPHSLSVFPELLLGLPRGAKKSLVFLLDATLCVFTVWLAWYLRLGVFVFLSGKTPFYLSIGASLLFALPVFAANHLYQSIFRYSALSSVVRAALLYGALYCALFTFYGVPGVPRTLGIIQPVLLLFFLLFSRLAARVLFSEISAARRLEVIQNTLIYGAGRAGRQSAAALRYNPRLNIIGFLDDNPQLHGHFISHLPVHDPARLPELAAALPVHLVLLAVPSLPHSRRREILENLRKSAVIARVLPDLHDLSEGKIGAQSLHEPSVADILGRETVAPDPALLQRNIQGKTVLVTGAGGSIGSELCRQILALNPRRLVLVEQSEFALYSISKELAAHKARQEEQTTEITPTLASVRDEASMRRIFARFAPESVYHAAAYKHVPLAEHNPAEFLDNNVFGTLTLARAAADAGSECFMLISTDKAVRPSGVMGASKRLAEMILQALWDARKEREKTTCFSMVRFGNVLDSSGSVVPLFREQIRNGGPVTLTHPEATRYFMSIREAAELVLQASALAKGGDVFALDMGEPVKILRLAQTMIWLSGLTPRDKDHPTGDVRIDVTGLRPSEKLHEEIWNDSQQVTSTAHPRIFRASESFLPWNALTPLLETLRSSLADNDLPAIYALLQQTVHGYATPSPQP
ncbi:MAG: polysaccharide biosynthesis protein [Zoogloeaceae bacterium]|nr:polysaccharide biosynthesis protein [Zoogloeaceae bacterium]